jgi:hypothetical protein
VFQQLKKPHSQSQARQQATRKGVAGILVADVVLLLAVYLVNLDVQNRINCAVGLAPYCSARSDPSFSYSLLTQFFSMRSGNMLLTSPPTLDWTQVLILLLIVINIWFFLPLFRRRSTTEPKV